MTTVTSLTADRMLAIEAASVVDGDVIGGNLILTKHDGSQINAGSVTGPTGPQGPQGALLPVISGVPVLDVGLANQIRAGRQLTAADFTNMGLSAPLGLWNLSDLTDVSGNGRNLLNKGAVPFGTGINGGANTAAQFSANSGQALYISDTGAADPFKIKTGSFGCWYKTTPRTNFGQALIGKRGGAAGTYGWELYVGSANNILAWCTADGTSLVNVGGVSIAADDRWHFAVVTVDGTFMRMYFDAVLEGTATFNNPIFNVTAPLNIGAESADGSTNATSPNQGRIDEAFITADVLSEDQIRNLYCAKIPHTLAAVPSRISLNVHRRRKGAALAVADFPTQPLRLYNFSGGSLGDEGSNGQALTLGGPISVAGADGSSGNAYSWNGASQSLYSTDAGLPSALATRSYGCWFKTISIPASGLQVLINWGAVLNSTDSKLVIYTGGLIGCYSGADAMTGPFVSDGQWHFVVAVEDNAAVDGVKRKLYLDGRLVGSSGVMNPTTLGGAAHLFFGYGVDSFSYAYNGQMDAEFICGYALTSEQIAKLYSKSLMTLSSSPKNPGDHVEAMSTTSLLATFDTLESQHTIDLGVEP